MTEKSEINRAEEQAINKIKAGCESIRSLFSNPLYVYIVAYLARESMYVTPGLRCWRNALEIAEEVGSVGINEDDVNWPVLDFLIEEGWIKKHPMGSDKTIYLEITDQGIPIGKLLSQEAIRKLFKNLPTTD